MIATIKSEFLKIFTVRSTYIILGLTFGLEFLFAFYLTAWRAKPEQLISPVYLTSQVTSAINVLILLASIAAILLVTHEYRYNTIAYTLTANKSRTSVFLAKVFAISVFAIIFSLVFGFLSPALSILAIKMHGLTLGHQDFATWNIIWRMMVYGWCTLMFATILSFIIRIQVGAIAAFFLIPSLVENILGLLLKANQVYLPFSSIGILTDSVTPTGNHISYERAALVGASYAVVGLIISWILFLKRDAS